MKCQTGWHSGATARHALLGALFGCCFPIIAGLVDLYSQGVALSWAAFGRLQASQPLHWIIDTAPLFLGLFAAFIGRRQDQALSLNAKLRNRVEQLTRAHLAAEASTRSKSRFLADMSHEIRTPMNGVLGMLDMLLTTELNEEQQRYCEIIRRSSESLLRVINDILDFSKLEAGRLELVPVAFDLGTAISDVVDLLAPRAHEKGLALKKSIDPAIPADLWGDAGRLRQILTNLCGNAVKFTEQGSISIQASLADLQGKKALVHLSVIDTGPGIPADRLHRLFQTFSQVDDSPTRKHSGSGLGLVLSKRLAEMMGGEMGVESVAGEGSTFWFTVVMRPVKERPHRSRTHAA